MSKEQLEAKVQEYREMNILLNEVQETVDALKGEIIAYMVESNLEEETTNTSTITYKGRSRSSLSEGLLKEALKTDDLSAFKTNKTYKVLNIR